MIPSKSKFNRLKNKRNKTFCDVLYLNKNSFAGNNKTFAITDNCKTCKTRFKKQKDAGIKYLIKHTKDYKSKLKKTKILKKDFEEVMKENDSKQTFHYLDPPYYKLDKVYKENGVTPERVCKVAKQMRGKVMISYNDHPEVRKSCKGLKFKKIKTKYTMNHRDGRNDKQAKEVIITNY